jgi:hypothetical protein
MAVPSPSRVSRPDRSATATRKSSDRRMVRAASTAACRVVLAPCGGPHPAQDVLPRTRPQAGRVAEELHALRRLLEQVGGEAAAGQGVREPLGGRALVAQQPQVPVGGPELVADLAEGEQTRVRVGLVGEPAEHDRQQLALDRGPSATPQSVSASRWRSAPCRVAETQRGEPLPRRLGSQAHLVGEAGHGREQRAGRRSARAAGAPPLLGLPLGDHGLRREDR